MIIFKHVRWKNLLSTGNNFVEVDLSANRSTILLGPSGSGKSTLLDAISFGLFNRPFRNINKNQLVNTINQKNCVVEIEFTVGTQEFLVRRGIKPNVFEIFCDKSLINQDSHTKDYQSYLERQILKFNFKAFTQIVVLGASNFTPFMQLKPADRRTIIEGLLDIEIFSAMNTILKQKVSNLKTQAQDVEFNLSIAREKIDVQQRYIADLSQDRQDRIQENLDQIETHKKHSETLKGEIDDLTAQIDSLIKTIEFKTDVTSQIDKLRSIGSRLDANIKQQQTEISFYETNDNCPTCRQKIDADFKQTEVAKKMSKIEEWTTGIGDMQSAMSKLVAKLDEAKEVESKISSLRGKVSKKQSEIDGISQFIKKLAKDTLELRKESAAPKDSLEKLNQLKSEVEALEGKRSDFSHEKNVHDLATVLLKDGGVKARIIKQYLPLINKHTNIFLNSMNFFVTFNLDEEFNESIKSRARDEFAYENFSEGEKQRIDLALLFTWRTIAKMKNSVNTNLLIMDEVLDSYLDTMATENVLQLLNSDMFKETNIFVISHKETISDKFAKVIRFTKTKNFSTLY